MAACDAASSNGAVLLLLSPIRPGVASSAADYLEFSTLSAAERFILAANGADRSGLTNKRTFARLCGEHALPTPAILAWGEAGRLEEAADLPLCDLFSKPGASANGRGATIWKREGARWSDGNQSLDRRGVLAEVTRRSVDSPHMLQRRIANHPQIRGLGSGGASTARIVTIKFPSARAEHLQSVFKMSANGAAADNFMRGGLLSPIDASRGRLGPALLQGSSSLHEVHPDTGATITGASIPHWEEALNLCLRAHEEMFGKFASVGWDVAFTPEGPTLVEGNWNWSEELLQLAHDRPLGATRLPECYLAHLAKAGIV